MDNYNNGYLYLVQPDLSVLSNSNEPIYKIGMSNSDNNNRLKSYGKNCKLYRKTYKSKYDIPIIEKQIIKCFKNSFNKVKGNEYFKGDIKDMEILFDMCIVYYENGKDINDYKKISIEISNVCKEIKYMASYSGGEFDTMFIDYLSWIGIVKTMFNTSLKERKIYLENQSDYDLNNSLKLGELKINRIKRIIKPEQSKESGNYKEEKEVETDEEYFRKNMKNKGVYLIHPHHLKYYHCKLWLKFGFRPTKNNNLWEEPVNEEYDIPITGYQHRWIKKCTDVTLEPERYRLNKRIKEMERELKDIHEKIEKSEKELIMGF